MTVNIVTWAYILGTITLLVTKQDEETGKYRERMQTLAAYCAANGLPPALKANMQGLLRLHMSLQGEATSDEAVLAVFPTSVRRRILRQLYAEPLARCYLFQVRVMGGVVVDGGWWMVDGGLCVCMCVCVVYNLCVCVVTCLASGKMRS